MEAPCASSVIAERLVSNAPGSHLGVWGLGCLLADPSITQ